MTSTPDDLASTSVPLSVRVSFGHAVLQTLADDVGADLLHIKGIAADPSLVEVVGAGSDVDVLVRPRDVGRLLDILRSHGWRVYSEFETGSPFGHAATLDHDLWGFADVHKHFPGIGIGPEAAFDKLWESRATRSIAAVECQVPSHSAQVLIMVLNVARSGGSATQLSRVRSAWHDVAPQSRQEVQDLVTQLRADVAFAAGLGDLERFRGHGEYRLWKVASQGGTRSEEWMGRILAAPTAGAAVRLLLRAALVNTEHLALRIGHEPSPREVVWEFLARPMRGVKQELSRYRARRAGGRR